MKKFIYFPIICIIFLINCKGKELVSDEIVIDPTDAKAVSKVLIMPDGTQTTLGNPPSPSTDTRAPKVTGQPSTIPTQNGNAENIGFQYSNLNGGVRSVYVQVEGADTYYNVPINNPNINGSGRITLPISLPETLGSGNFYLGYCVVDYSGRISNIIRTGFNITRVAPINPAVGNGSFVVNGQTFNGQTQCDVAKQYGNYLDVDLILSDNGQSVFLYNMKPGSNVLVDPFNTPNFSLQKDPWIGYLSGGGNGNGYYSKSGTVTKSGNKVSFSSLLYIPLSSSTISIRGAINCQ